MKTFSPVTEARLPFGKTYCCIHVYEFEYFHNRCQFGVIGISVCVVSICRIWFKPRASNIHSACQS